MLTTSSKRSRQVGQVHVHHAISFTHRVSVHGVLLQTLFVCVCVCVIAANACFEIIIHVVVQLQSCLI